MSDSLASPNPTMSARVGRRRVLSLRQLVPAEGVAVVFLHLTMVLAAAWSVLEAGWVDGLGAMPVLVLAGSAIGLLLAKAEAPDLASHLTAFWLGLFIVVTHTVVQYPDLGVGLLDRTRELALLFERWTRSTAAGDRLDDVHLFTVLMGLTGWLVAYMSAWTLYRRGWVTASVLLPGAVMLIDLGYRSESSAAPLVLYLVSAGALVVAHFARRRRWDWQARGLQTPSFIPSRILGLGFNAVLIVTVLSWLIPVPIRDDLLTDAWRTVERPVESVQGQIQDLVGNLTGDGRNRGETYATFDDSFDLGGALDLSDDPMLAFSGGGEAPYLAAHRMDAYDGHGWRSDADATFERSGSSDGTYSSRVQFDADQPVALGAAVTAEREQTGGTIRVLSPSANLVFTRDTYRTADVPTSVQLSWRSTDGERFPIGLPEDRAVLPPDLRRIATLLTTTSFSEDGEGIDPVEAQFQRQVANQREELAARLLTVTWVVAGGAATELIVTGPLPVYDDIESIESRTDLAVSDSYDIGGLVSSATFEDLGAAGTDYPDYVVDRYLQLPTTVTDRTRSLARTLVDDQGATTPFDMAVVIQNDLRERIEYTETPSDPPSNQDVVDYVLFESRVGYCEYYASAMAVMMRTLGVPARVVTGFFPPAYDPAQGYVYREENAHVWVEVFFPGYGWIPFEPTANRAAPTFGEDDAAPSASPSPSPSVSEAPSPSPESDTSSPSPEPSVEPSPSAPPPATTGLDDANPPLGGPLGWVVLALGIGLALVLLLAVVLMVAWWRGFRGMTPATALYARMVRLGGWLRIRGAPSTTPAEYADRVAWRVPMAGQAARTVAEQYVTEQYAPAREQATSSSARRAWIDVRRAMLRAILRALSPWRRRGLDER